MIVPCKRSVLSLFLLSAAPLMAATPEGSPFTMPQPPFYGQIRPRMEFDSKDIRDTSVNKGLLNNNLSTRLGFVAAPSPKTEITVEVQDVRFWGAEPQSVAANPATASIGNLRGVDLLQGYFAIEEGPVKAAFGRQKMQLGAGRFLSTLDWSPTSRAFDGVAFNVNLDPGTLTGLSYLVRDTNTTTTKDHLLLSGLYYSHQINADIVAEAFGFYDKSTISAPGGAPSVNHDLYYIGERVAGTIGLFTFEEEFIWQGGDVPGAGPALEDRTSAAFQLATRLGVALGTRKVNLGLDIMSGDKDAVGADDELNTYRANYYFAHAYFGWMDYFISNPRSGVMDWRVDATLPFLPNAAGNARLTIVPQYHFFTPHNAPSGADDPYGQEFDLEIHLGLYPKSNIVLGAGLFIPGDGAVAANLPVSKRSNADNSTQNGLFLYFMPVFNF